MRQKVTSVFEIKDFSKIQEGVYSTGELGTNLIEQSIIINYQNGLIVITGRTHPGITDIVKTASKSMDRNVYLLMGGFYYPPRGTAKEFKDGFIESGVGKEIKLPFK